MNENKYQIRVKFDEHYTDFSIAKNSTISKMIKIIEIYFEELIEIVYDIIWDDVKNLKMFDRELKLADVFIRNESTAKEDEDNSLIELIIVKKDNAINNYKFECVFNNSKKGFKLSKNLEFQHLKINIVALFPELELENFSILHNRNDITNIYYKNIKLVSIFSDAQSKYELDAIKLILLIDDKNFVELHKKCKLCKKFKAAKICIKCTNCYCEECYVVDSHASNKTNFVSVGKYNKYEHETLNNIQESLKEMQFKNMKLSSNNFTKIANEKISSLEKKFDDIIELIDSIKTIQINNLTKNIDLIKNKFKPESLNDIIQKFTNTVSSYSNNPYVDIEESAKKINEFENFSNSLKSDFLEYHKTLNDFTEKYLSSSTIDNNILDYLKNNLIESRHLFITKHKERENYKPILKVYDNKSVVVYDHNTEEFCLMNFIDIDGKFKESFNNYVQYNYTRHNKLFVLTGNPCQKLFCYDYVTNEMEFIASMKYNHNWWPVLLILEKEKEKEISSNILQILALTGSYTKKCERLVITGNSSNNLRKNQIKSPNGVNEIVMNYIDLPDTNCEHGQASAFGVNQSVIYILFGYDYNINSIAYIERLDLNSVNGINNEYDINDGNSHSAWELIQFKNPDQISAILYYHSNLVIDENTILIVGGLKEINQGDIVYKLDMNGSEEGAVLIKTEYDLNMINVKFCFEKNMIRLNSSENDLHDYESHIERISVDLDNTLNFSKINSDINKNMKNRNTNLISEETTYGIFDSNNNIHIIKPKQFEYKYKQFHI